MLEMICCWCIRRGYGDEVIDKMYDALDPEDYEGYLSGNFSLDNLYETLFPSPPQKPSPYTTKY